MLFILEYGNYGGGGGGYGAYNYSPGGISSPTNYSPANYDHASAYSQPPPGQWQQTQYPADQSYTQGPPPSKYPTFMNSWIK